VVLALLIAAIMVSTLHLGRVRNAVRSLLNLRSSWLSREVLLALVLLVVTALAWWPNAPAGTHSLKIWIAWLGVPAALAFMAGMARVYMQRSVPVWNHWRTPLGFLATAVFLGGSTANALLWSVGDLGVEQARQASLVTIAICVFGAGMPWTILRACRRDKRSGLLAKDMIGGASVIAGLALLAVLAAELGSPQYTAASIWSWIVLTLALIDQIGQRREFYARYERLGI
jgi:DMSO reductase anchor subunit